MDAQFDRLTALISELLDISPGSEALGHCC
jgi:hypothetical protein